MGVCWIILGASSDLTCLLLDGGKRSWHIIIIILFFLSINLYHYWVLFEVDISKLIIFFFESESNKPHSTCFTVYSDIAIYKFWLIAHCFVTQFSGFKSKILLAFLKLNNVGHVLFLICSPLHLCTYLENS